MATVLDVGILSYFVPVLVLLFVFVILYALFEKVKLFGEEKGLHALIAIIFSFLFILVKPLREFVITVTPWFVILFFIMFILLLTVMIFGFKESDIVKYADENSGIVATAVVIVVIIILIGLNNVYPGSFGFPENEDTGFIGIRKVVFNPKVLGILFVFIVSYIVMRAAGFSAKKEK